MDQAHSHAIKKNIRPCASAKQSDKKSGKDTHTIDIGGAAVAGVEDSVESAKE